MASLRDKTISGVFWSFLQQGGGKAIQLVTTIILARLLTPKDFGLIGMLTIFIALSQMLIQAGFSQALIQKKNADEEDFSSVFYINLVVSIGLYGILFFTAPFISDFYDQPLLTPLTRVLSVIFVINAFSYVQETRLKKELRFKTLMWVHLPSTVISGGVAIAMALLGYGVWSIVGQQVTMRLAFAVQIWIYAKWKPLWRFNKQKARGLFSFGNKLMISGIFQTVFDNIYLVVIGKFFPVTMVGYYQNARSLMRTPVSTLSGALSSVTYSVFSTIQDDNKRLREGQRKSVQQILFWTCPALVLAAVLAEPLFSFVLTDKWLPAVPFFQILCVVGVFMPLNRYNLNILNVKGRSDLYLKLNIAKKSIDAVGIACAIPFGIWALVGFQAFSALIKFTINSYYSGKFINYPLIEQIKDIVPTIALSLFIGVIAYFLNVLMMSFADWVRLLLICIIGGFIYYVIVKITRFSAYLDFHYIMKEKFRFFLKKRK